MNVSEINCHQVNLKNQKAPISSRQSLDLSSLHQAIEQVASTSRKSDKQPPSDMASAIPSETDISEADLKSIEHIKRLMDQCADITANRKNYTRGTIDWKKRKLEELERTRDSITQTTQDLHQKYGVDRINDLLSDKKTFSQPGFSEILNAVKSRTDLYAQSLSRNARCAFRKQSRRNEMSLELLIAAQREKSTSGWKRLAPHKQTIRNNQYLQSTEPEKPDARRSE